MKNFIKSLMCCAAAVILLGSCTRDKANDGPSGSGNVEARFTAGLVQTRAYDDQWEADDQIGIFMLHPGTEEIFDNVFNYRYVNRDGGTGFSPSNATNTVYMPQDGRQAEFLAYYPYRAELGHDMRVTVNTASQTALPQIDLITSEPGDSYNKDKPEVNLQMKHRLSKVIFVIDGQPDGEFVDPATLSLTVGGMNTTGTYDILERTWDIDRASGADISIPGRGVADQRYGIVLPREAGSGVTFTFTAPDGGVYSADMDPALELEPGYKYTFHFDLRKTGAVITAEIEDWVDGPETYYNIVQLTGDTGESTGFAEGDRMRLYVEDNGAYSLLTTFTYQSTGQWTSPEDIFWEDLPGTGNTINMRAAVTAAAALNTNQVEDILLTGEVTATRYRNLHLNFTHANSKLTFELTSDQFDAATLAAAEVILPNYATGASEQVGQLVPGTRRTDIATERVDGVPTAIIQPQGISAGDAVAIVRINGISYTATTTTARDFEAGTAYLIRLKVNATGVSVSARVVPWDEQQIDLGAVQIGSVAMESDGIENGEVMSVYTGDAATRTLFANFTYNEATDTWSSTPTTYWEDLPMSETFYASIDRAPAHNTTQVADILTAWPTRVTSGNAIDFELFHPMAKVTVQVTSSDDTYTDFSNMTLTLPDYETGGEVVNGWFVPGTGRGPITVAQNVGDDGQSAIALIQPQDVPAGETVVSLTMGNGQTYNATYDYDIQFQRNVATILLIDVRKTAADMSARVIPWQAGDRIPLELSAITVSGELEGTSDFFEDQPIYIYDLGDDSHQYIYQYANNGDGYRWTGPAVYWDDIQGRQLRLAAAYYPYVQLAPPIDPGQTTFTWTLPPDQRNGWGNYDLLMAYEEVPTPSYINFQFSHVLSGVRVELTSAQFSADQLRNATVTMLQMPLVGTADLETATVTPTAARANVQTYPLTDGAVYTALVMPYTVPGTQNILEITLAEYPNTPFRGSLGRDFTFQPGEYNVITVDLLRTGIRMDATVEEWRRGDQGEITIQ